MLGDLIREPPARKTPACAAVAPVLVSKQERPAGKALRMRCGVLEKVLVQGSKLLGYRLRLLRHCRYLDELVTSCTEVHLTAGLDNTKRLD